MKKGDTASKIANSIKPAGVSLDQMLVAMLRSNPDAFINDNLNRIRAGAVLQVPKTELAQSVSPSEASKLVVAQSKDFNDFRRNLATSAPTAAVASADRKASGSIEAKVEDKKPSSPAPDKLTLSKGSVQGKTDDAKIAKDREAKDAAARAAEISKNINELSKIGAATAPAAPAPAVASSAAEPAAPSTPAVAVAGVPAPATAPAPVASAPAATPTPAPTVAAPAPAAAPSAPAKPKAAAPVPMPAPEEPSLIDELLADPLVPAGAVGLLALLGGFAAYRVRQRKKNAAQVDSAFLESRLQPDSFFGASGGQRVDTNNGPQSASSMVYSASQLDAADDVDPVAEADVYLAYGRDLQAEEILKEAVRTNPGRLAIHTKLLEIFSKRRDTRSFESTATQAYKLTGASSPDWTRICEMGLAIDPSNPLYQPGGAPASSGGGEASAPASSFGNSTVAQPAHAALAETGGSGVDLDLDLDFSLDDEPAPSAISDVTGGDVSDRTVKLEAQAQDNSMEMDFDLPLPDETAATKPALEPVAVAMPEISLSLDDLETPMPEEPGATLKFEATGPLPVTPEPTPSQQASTGLMEFDLGSLSMELDGPIETPAEAPAGLSEDPLETKLALAEEFISIGDEDGARALIEEVVSEASGDMRAKAQRALAKLS